MRLKKDSNLEEASLYILSNYTYVDYPKLLDFEHFGKAMKMMNIKPLVHVLLLLLALSCSTSWVLTVAITSSSDAYPTLSASECAGDIVPLRREVYGDGKIFDISFRYSEDMPVWGSNEGLGQFLWLRMSMKNVSVVNVSELKFIVHSGTHVDTPAHVFDNYFDAGFDADALDLDFLNGNKPTY